MSKYLPKNFGQELADIWGPVLMHNRSNKEKWIGLVIFLSSVTYVGYCLLEDTGILKRLGL